MIEQSPFIPHQVYRRQTEINSIYGGNRQSGISASARNKYIFIFYGATGHQHGYKDEWLTPDVFSYSGEGQVGDMKFTKGNLALRDHLSKGRRVFLFKIKGGGLAEYITELEFLEADFFDTHDNEGKTRIGIKFFFKRKGAVLPFKDNIVDKPKLNDSKIALIPSITERSGLVTSRVGQGAYRKSIIYRWENKCAVTGFDKKIILIASHIVPWSKANDSERLDVDNGLLLSPTYDALFDRHLISFEDSGKIILSDKIEAAAFDKIGITGREKISKLSFDNLVYLDRHRGNLL